MEHTQIDTAAAVVAPPALAVERDALLPALQWLAKRLVERRNTIPILSNVLIEPGPDGGAIIRGTDLDMEGAWHVPAQWDAPGAFTVSALVFADAVKQAPKGALVRLVYHDGRVSMRAGRGETKLQVLPADDFPLMPSPEFTLSAEFDAAALSADFARISPAVSTEETRYYLQGIHFSVTGGNLAMAATDGHRLHFVERANPFTGDAAAWGQWGHILPRKFTGELQRLMAKHDGTVKLELSADKARATIGGLVIVSKLIDGIFSDYRKGVIDSAARTPRAGAWQGDAAAIIAACDAAGNGRASLREAAISLEFGNACRFGIAGADGFARPLSGEYEGGPGTFHYMPGYLSDSVKAIGGKVTIEPSEYVEGEAVQLPAVIRCADAPHFTAYLMPVRRDFTLPADAPLAFAPERTAPGQAGDLWGVHAAVNVSMSAAEAGIDGGGYGDRIAGKARAATAKECRAYLQDLARRWGFDTAGMMIDPEYQDGICIGATFGTIERATYGKPATYMDGAFSVAMPGARDAMRETVLLSVQDEATGEWSDFAKCQNAKGQIALPDAKRERKAPKGKAKPVTVAPTPIAAQEAPADAPGPQEAMPAATHPALTPEIAPHGAEIAPADAVEVMPDAPADDTAALLARIALLEAKLAVQAIAPVAEPAPAPAEPVADDDGPGLYAMAVSAETSPPPIGGNRRADRAVRERIVRAYLALRRQRVQMAAALADARYQSDEWEALQHRTWEQAQGHRMARRRAVTIAWQMRAARNTARDRAADRLIELANANQALASAESKRDHWQAMRDNETVRANQAMQDLATARQRITALESRPHHLGNEVRPDDVKRLTMERDAARAEAKGAITARDAIAAAVGRVETQLDVLLNRALVAENALRAVAARDARGDAPAVAVAVAA